MKLLLNSQLAAACMSRNTDLFQLKQNFENWIQSNFIFILALLNWEVQPLIMRNGNSKTSSSTCHFSLNLFSKTPTQPASTIPLWNYYPTHPLSDEFDHALELHPIQTNGFTTRSSPIRILYYSITVTLQTMLAPTHSQLYRIQQMWFKVPEPYLLKPNM